MMSVYAICTGSRRNEPFVPVIFRFENFRRRNGSHKIPLFQRVLWWARQGLNLRPHPCEGELQSRVSILFLHDNFRPPNSPCTSFVRRSLAYWFSVRRSAPRGPIIAKISDRVLPICGGSDGRPWPPTPTRKTAGRAATLRSGSIDSCAAIAESYRCTDSRASVLFGEGCHEHHPFP